MKKGPYLPELPILIVISGFRPRKASLYNISGTDPNIHKSFCKISTYRKEPFVIQVL